MSHKLCRFAVEPGLARAGVLDEPRKRVLDLSTAGLASLQVLLDSPNPTGWLADLLKSAPAHPVNRVRLLAPVEQQEVWAAGVTYLRSKRARMEESEFSANAYDRVYDAARPEIFFKSLPEKVSGPGGPVGIRKDATWNVPEPELALVLNSRGGLVGYTVGNDMSSRDIEGENLLYLPQAKVYRHSCALGPCIVIGATEAEARKWDIRVEIKRRAKTMFSGVTSVGQIKRSFTELADYLGRSQEFPHGAVLLTGTGVVPADDFTLRAGDVVRIEISGIGRLENQVVVV